MTQRLQWPNGSTSLTRAAWLLLVATLCLASPAPGSAASISTAFQDSYPKFYLDEQGLITGICAELSSTLINTIGNLRDISSNRLMPLRRIRQRLAEEDGIDFFMGLAFNEERAQQYEYVYPELYQVNHVIAVRRDDLVDLSSLSELDREEPLMTIGGSSTQRYLENQGFTDVDGSANDSAQLLRKLVHRRARFVYFNDIALRAEIKRMGLQNEVRILPISFRQYAHYLVINKNTDPEVREAILAAYQAMREQGVIDDILLKYVGED